MNQNMDNDGRNGNTLYDFLSSFFQIKEQVSLLVDDR